MLISSTEKQGYILSGCSLNSCLFISNYPVRPLVHNKKDYNENNKGDYYVECPIPAHVERFNFGVYHCTCSIKNDSSDDCSNDR